MAKASSKSKKTPAPAAPAEAAPEELALGDDAGMSLEELAQTYASLMTRGGDPYAEEPPAPEPTPVEAAVDLPIKEALAAENPPADDGQVSPSSILEAILFVGHPQNIPLSARQIAALMRGVSPHEIDELVKELNAAYDTEGAAYMILSVDDGYRLALRAEFSPVREKFYGRVKDARLSQGAVDVLAVVAYHQPVSGEQVDKLRGKPSGGLLNQLVRRDLLLVERPPDSPRKPHFRTTDRFLDLFGLSSLQDLPQSQEPDSAV